MPEIRLREPLAGVVAKIADKLNGDYSAPGAVTFGNVTVYLVVPDDALRRHEAVHRQQAERFRPWWAIGPLRKYGYDISVVRFTAYYLAEHRRVGYEASKFEVEARAAE
jgi:hypothetical protein